MSHQSSNSPNQRLCASIVLFALIALCVASFQVTEAKFLRRSRYYDDGYLGGGSAYPLGGSSMHGASVPTGERAIMTIRGTRNPYDGSAPSKIAIEDNPYRGAYPRGVYDRLDNGFSGGRGGYPMRQDLYDYSNGYGGGRGMKQLQITASSKERRYDFLDPDFGIKTSINLNGKRRSKCRLASAADSEIPELGLDTARLNVNCDLNPRQVVGAAARVAQKLSDYKRRKKASYHPQKSSPTVVKRKRTKINIDREYARARGLQDDDDLQDNIGDHDAESRPLINHQQPENTRPHQHQSSPSAVSQDSEDDDGYDD